MTSPVLTERRQSGGYLVSEASGERSREQVTLKQQPNGTILDGGTILGRIGVSTGAPVWTANPGNTGNGAMGAIVESAGAIVGDYRLTFVDPATNAGTFEVFDPNGAYVGTGKVGVAFAGGGLGFTLADGAVDFVGGDGGKVTVAPNADAGKYTVCKIDAADGSQKAAAILFNSPFDVTSGDTKQTVTKRHSEVNGSELTYPPNADIGAVNAQLEALGIIVR